ncbi:MAG TPA: RsbRD N-terminal domain-containing protein [Pyrinomonadaceae bacterium]|nr:RsbRD N-terminal domain-containing protein [Pyrinomonadaceae bacterium]
MPEEISRLLLNGHETIVQKWTEKVTADRRVRSDSQLTYLQLVDHVPQIVEELRRALTRNERPEGAMLQEGRNHGRQRWQQGYELKEVVRELTLLRATLIEFLDTYRGAIPAQSPDQMVQHYNRIAGFMDEEIYKTVEAYLEAPGDAAPNGGMH